VIHQVSATHTNTLAAQLGLSREKIFTIFEEFGNIGPAGVPTVLAKTVEAGRVKKGDRVALLGIGSGLNCSMMDVQW
jgi:3-oxoacyl-[acyl-carrier-protein] synthase-3